MQRPLHGDLLQHMWGDELMQLLQINQTKQPATSNGATLNFMWLLEEQPLCAFLVSEL